MSKKTTKKNDHATRRQFLGVGGAAAATVALGAITTKAQTTDGECLTGACAADVGKLRANGRAVHVIGKVADGKVTFDQASLDAFAKAFPDAEMCFVAVNAPFDPVAQANA